MKLVVIGQRFGRWKIIGDAPTLVLPSGYTEKRVRCVCDCGTRKIVTYGLMRKGQSNSCGCLRDELASKRAKTHGHSVGKKVTRTMQSWLAMRQRCNNPKHQRYRWYGGKGIKVCARWQSSFENFLADMGLRPVGKTLDRKDNSKNYTKKNCRWATSLGQARNRG